MLNVRFSYEVSTKELQRFGLEWMGGGQISRLCSFDDHVVMMMCAFDFALTRRVLALLCSASFQPTLNGIFTSSEKRNPNLVMLDLV